MVKKFKNFLVSSSSFLWNIFWRFISVLIFHLGEIIVTGMIIIIVLFFAKAICDIYNSIKQDHKERQAIARYCHSLKENGWKELKADKFKYGYAYNSAELLARKRCDNEFGEGKYVFQSTNINGRIYFKVKTR